MSRSDDINRVLDMVRQLVSVVKDESIPAKDADKTVGKLLVSIDQLMMRIDGAEDLPPVKDHIKKKIEIEAPPRTSRRSTKGKANK